MLQLNNGNGMFSDVGQLAGISSTDWSWAPLLADFNNDGLVDLYITNGYGRDMINRDVMKFYIDERVKYIEGNSDKKMFEVLQGIESTPLQNYFYLNKWALTFEDSTTASGLAGTDFSHGAIYTDLDNDGDLEIVVNCMNEPAKVFKNLTREQAQHTNYLSLKISQKDKNIFALGAKIMVFTSEGKKLVRELSPTRGFQSSLIEPVHFGLGTQTVDSIQIQWNDLSVKTIKEEIPLNQRVTIIKESVAQPQQQTEKPIFTVRVDTIQHSHNELLVNDFKVQPLIPYMI